MKKTRITKECLACGGEFEAYLYSIKNGHGLYCNMTCYAKSMKGKPNSQKGVPNYKIRGANNPMARAETREKHRANVPRGDKHPSWKGGVTSLCRTIRKSPEYIAWRLAIFKRDDYTCQICYARSGNGKRNDIHADHIKPFALYPELRFQLSNGRTLCVPCHRKTETYGSKTARLIKEGAKL